MAFWNSTQITNIYTGATANDSSGDPIRDAFTKVDENFSNVSIQLSQFNQDWTNANIEFNLNANTANIGNLSIGSIYGNVNMSGTLLPIGTGFNLGTPSNPIGNIYASFQSINNTVTNTSTAGLFLIHATDPVTDIQDTGIFGNVYNNYGSNTYAFFGHQYTTNDFIYKITPIDATKGNNIVVGGVYGNAQFGSAFLSNSTPGGNTLVVNGNIGVTGTMYTNNGMVLTTNTPGLVSYSGTTIANVVITGSNTSTSPTTGALILSYGGVGVAGNVNTGGNVAAAGLVGPLYGTVMTAGQPNITSVGTLTSLNVGSVSATSVGATTVTVGSTLSMSGAALTGLSTLSVGSLTTTANTNSGNVIASGFYFANGAPFVSSNYGNTQVAVYLPTNATIYTLQANVGAFEITTNANIGGQQLAIASINANLSSYQNTTNANIGAQFNNLNTLTANVGAFETYSNLTFATSSATSTSLQTLNANVGSYQNTTNANIGAQFNNFNTLNANVGAYQIWANANVASHQTAINSLYTNANANTAAYLTTATINTTGNITGGNITSAGTVTVGNLVVTGNTSLTNFTNGNTNVNVTPGIFYVNIGGVSIFQVTSAGLIMGAPISMGGFGIGGLATPSASDGAATKAYADGAATTSAVPSGDLGTVSGSNQVDAFNQSITPYTVYDMLNTPTGSVLTVDYENTTSGSNYVAKNPI